MSSAKTAPWVTDYKYHEKYEDKEFTQRLLAYTVEKAEQSTTRDIYTESTDSMVSLCRAPLLSRDGEWMMFMKMNYLKHLATKVLEEITNNSACHKLLTTEYESLVKKAIATRNDIVTHNIRLVVNLAKQQRMNGMNIGDWISNGSISLLKAIDKFDPNRANDYGGVNKFSTYATWAIIKNYWRDRHPVAKVHGLTITDIPIENLSVVDQHTIPEDFDAIVTDESKLIDKEIKKLPWRQRIILQRRFGLDGAEAASLEVIGKDLGISKERVRQLQLAAVITIKRRLGLILTTQEATVNIRHQAALTKYYNKKLKQAV